MSRPESSPAVQYVGLDEEQPASVYTYVAAPSYDSSAYVYPTAVPLDNPMDAGIVQETNQSAGPANAAPKCRGKLCGATWMVRVALVLFIVALVTPNWFTSSSTVRVVVPAGADVNNSDNSNNENVAPPVPSPPAGGDDTGPTEGDDGNMPPPPPPASDDDDATDGNMPPPPPFDENFAEDSEHGFRRRHHGHHGHSEEGREDNQQSGAQLGQFHDVVTLPDNSTLVSARVHAGLWRACMGGECHKLRCCNRDKASPMCGSSKASGSLLIAGASLVLVSLLALCCDRRGKFEGSRKVWIAPALVFIALVLGTVAVVLAGRTRHAIMRAPVHAMMAPPAAQVSLIARDVQFGSSFYLAIMGLMSMFYGWLALMCHACHQRCAGRCPSEGGARRRWFCSRRA